MGEEAATTWHNSGSGGGGSSGGSAIGSSNIGFRLLKKQGWQEGTGLGASQQGRLEPVQACMKTNKRGLGAEVKKKKAPEAKGNQVSDEKTDKEQLPPKRKSKTLSKRMKMLDEEKRSQEREFEREFFKLFWPDNV